jgi:ubiquinone/menaquinone biosynthesis C-methylase UbiE
MEKLFLEIYENLPRQGPGSTESTRKAFESISDLPTTPRILDIGCGIGNQTLELARISDGVIVALDSQQSFVDSLRIKSSQLGLTEKVRCVAGDMFSLDFDAGSFDVIWSEGAIYIIGFEKGLREWRKFLAPGGLMAVTEITWLNEGPPEEIETYWKKGYPGMNGLETNLAIAEAAGYRLVEKFVLPEDAWWDDYYDPLEDRILDIRNKYAGDEITRKLCYALELEIDMYRKYSEWYGCVFYILQRND